MTRILDEHSPEYLHYQAYFKMRYDKALKKLKNWSLPETDRVAAAGAVAELEPLIGATQLEIPGDDGQGSPTVEDIEFRPRYAGNRTDG